METIGTLGIVFVLAFLSESLVEYIFGAPFNQIPKLTPYRWLLQYVALLVGVALAFAYQLDIIGLIAVSIGVTVLAPAWVGFILTGLAIGRGSEWLHKFLGKFLPNVGTARYPGA